jgi:hypothetical protein
VDSDLSRQIEQHVLRFVATPSRQFAELRASAQVDLALLRLGARHHPNAKVRWQCLTLLDHLDGDESVSVFLDAMRQDPVPRVRRHALHALTCERCKEVPLCADVVPALMECAENDANIKVRLQARRALAQYVSDARAARFLSVTY